MKKLVMCILALMLIANQTVCFARGEAYFSISNGAGYPGDIVDITASIDCSEDFDSILIHNIEYDKVAPTASICKLVCREFNVNPYWLETGSGEMFNAVDDVEKAVSFYMSALKGGTEADDNFKKVFVAELAGVLDALGPAGWQAVKQMIVNVYEAQQGEK